MEQPRTVVPSALQGNNKMELNNARFTILHSMAVQLMAPDAMLDAADKLCGYSCLKLRLIYPTSYSKLFRVKKS